MWLAEKISRIRRVCERKHDSVRVERVEGINCNAAWIRSNNSGVGFLRIWHGYLSQETYIVPCERKGI